MTEQLYQFYKTQEDKSFHKENDLYRAARRETHLSLLDFNEADDTLKMQRRIVIKNTSSGYTVKCIKGM